MGAHLYAKLIDPSCYNLSTEGGSCLSSLEIIEKSGKIPEILLVEINSINRPNSIKVADYLFQPFIFELRKFLPALRNQNQPILYTAHLFAIIADKISYELKKISKKVFGEVADENLLKQPSLPILNKDLIKQLRSDEINQSSDLSDTSEIKIKMNVLVEDLNKLKKQGVKIVFYEMPTEEFFQKSLKSKYIRELANVVAEKNNFYKIPVDNNLIYKTIDVVHLEDESAKTYTEYIKKYLIQLKLL